MNNNRGKARKLKSKSENEDFEDFDLDDILAEDFMDDDEDMDMIEDIDLLDSDDVDDEDDEDESKKTSKHKENDKHRLKHDIIFKGKKETLDELEDTSTTYFNDNFSYDPSTIYHYESNNNLDYNRDNKLKEAIYKIILTKTNVNIENNRRKPSYDDFNIYYKLAYNDLSIDGYTNCQIFVELAYYFSDNLANMFKLLKPKWRNEILGELKEHIGEPPENSKEIMPKNLTVGAEIEFEAYSNENKCQLITGVIKAQNHEERLYYVDTFESIYEVHIDAITKILNNEKFRYNLNKLKNIDFL